MNPHKRVKPFIFGILLILFAGCQSSSAEPAIEEWKQEIMQAETDFAQMAAQDGISNAFRAYAAEEVALKRRNKLVIGKKALFEEYDDLGVNPDVSLTWAPDFIDVSQSGDMAYTYGKYVFSKRDSLGTMQSNTGVFHTVWKRQEDGSWKFVWD
ncbi:MAG: nuclear transport factor 2 family protein [Ekhidna sp.]